MNAIRFKSIMQPDKIGFEYCEDSMQFWESRTSGILNIHWGYYETYGDGTTQHTPLMACRPEHFVDFIVSLLSHMEANPEVTFPFYRHELFPVSEGQARFFASIKFRDDKRQWFNRDELKVSTSESRQHDRRWIKVPTWADGTIKSAISLYYMDERGYARFEYETFAAYAVHHAFKEVLIEGVLEREGYDENIEFIKLLPEYHRQAFVALQNRYLVNVAKERDECDFHNLLNCTAPKAEEPSVAA